MQKKATRREFLKTGTRIAGTVFLTGLPGACKRASGKTGARPAGIDAQPTPRDSYTLFSPGNIGTMTVKNRLVRSAGFKTTLLDHNLKRVQFMRQLGVKTFLGDPTRPDLLHARR